MDKTLIIVIAVVGVLAIGGGIAAAIATQNTYNDQALDQVTYYGNGGLYQGQSSIGSTTSEAIPNPFTYDSKSFIAWNTKSDGTGTWIDPGENVRMGMKLYAQWTKFTLSIQDISFIFYGLNFYKMDSSGQMQKINTFVVPLNDNGQDTIYMGGWDAGTIALAGTSILGDINGTHRISTYLFEPPTVDARSIDGNYVKIDLTYDSSITLDGTTR